MSTLTLVAGNMLYGGPVGLAHKLGEARLVDEMAACPVNADPPHMLQTFNQSEHGGGCGRFWHLTQPSQPVLTTVLSALRQRIETPTLLGRQAIGQPVIDFLPSAMTNIDAEPFECRRPWQDNPALPALLHDQFSQVAKPLVFNRPREQPTRQLSRRSRSEWPQQRQSQPPPPGR
jgi:hypothetical protein